jgi:hypothetical protein
LDDAILEVAPRLSTAGGDDIVSEMKDRVECARHGSREATYVCQHLVSGEGTGFNYAYGDEDPDELWPGAWCDACERVLDAEGEWNARSEAFARIRLLCDGCYQTVRERNWTQDDAAFKGLMSDAVAYLQPREDQLSASFGLDRFERYDWTLRTSQLIFSDRGQPRVAADIQLVGSISTRSHSWLWSWANRSVLESLRHRVREVREYGETHRYLKLASAAWEAGEGDGWEMTAITAYLIGAAGAYRAPGDRNSSFLAITDIHWVQ